MNNIEVISPNSLWLKEHSGRKNNVVIELDDSMRSKLLREMADNGRYCLIWILNECNLSKKFSRQIKDVSVFKDVNPDKEWALVTWRA